MEQNLGVNETAYITSTYRSTNADLSKDPYAKLWNTPATDLWVKEHIESVSEHEPHLHCLRNRYFFEQINSMFKEGSIKTLINFGCGFSMYPFSLPDGLQHIEIDFPEIVRWKEERLNVWMAQGVLPGRTIHFIGTDLSSADSADLVSQIKKIQGENPSFILLEGVLFFLTSQQTDFLFDLFSEIQQSGSFVGSVSFQDTLEEKAVFKRLIDFCASRLNYGNNFHYQVIPDLYYQNHRNYILLDHQDGNTLNRQFSPSYNLPPNDFLNENMYLLQKR